MTKELDIPELLALCERAKKFDHMKGSGHTNSVVAEYEQAAAEALPAALTQIAALQRSRWQPIETAPKDGTPVDLWIPKKAKGNRGPAQRCSDCQYIKGKWQLGGEFELPWLQDATHWMPLPEPPK